MEKQNEPVTKTHAFFILFISAFMITVSFTFESNKKDVRVLNHKKINLTKEKSPNYLFESAHKAKIVLMDGDTVDVVIVGRKPFMGEVVVITDSIESGEYLVK
jgi:hypothetical protein